MRNFQFQTGAYYHIYNRGIDKRKVFMDENDYLRFIRSMREFNNIKPIGSLHILSKQKQESGLTACEAVKPLVDIICYCLIPNHYHFFLKQLSDGGISEFSKRLIGGYTWYFNYKYNRTGSLFEGTFKAIHVDKDSYLLWLSGYINGNTEIHKITKAEDWPWSSYKDFLGLRKGTLCNKNVILKDFQDTCEYRDLVDVIIKESSERKAEIKQYLLE